MTARRQTPAQTVGPFFHDALMRHGVEDLDPKGTAGSAVIIVGSVRDGENEPVRDAMIEVWQADGGGRYRHPADGRASDVPSSFIGFGRIATDQTGSFRLTTVMPGTVPGPRNSVQAPHLSIHIFARGLLDKLATRMYFDGHPANDHDPVLGRVPEARRDSLVAQPEAEIGGIPSFRFDIVLQGPGETVFFDA